MLFPLQVAVPGAFLYGAVLVAVATVLGLVGYAMRADADEAYRKVIAQVGQYGTALAALLALGHLVTQGTLAPGSFQTLFVGVLAAVGGYKIHERGQKGGREAERERAKEVAKAVAGGEDAPDGEATGSPS